MFYKKKGKTDTKQHALKFFIEIDSFQDPQIDSHSKMSQIDSFQDPHIVDYFGLISRPLVLHPNRTHYRIPNSELSQTQPNSVISRPAYWISTVF